MLTYFECRRRVGRLCELYKVRSWYLCGVLLVYRRYEQLTVASSHATASEAGE